MRRKRAAAASARRTAGHTGRGGPELMLDINTTPLIDVMLVLLVMLIITIPIQLHAVHLELPVAAPVPPNRPPLVRIDIAADGSVHWQGTVASAEELDRRMALAAREALPPEIQVRAHKDSRYAVFAAVLSASRRHGLAKVAVVAGEHLP